MKAIRIEVVVRPKSKPTLLRLLKTRLFHFVEGDIYTYQATIRNVGDEALDPKDLLAIQFRWEFTTGQTNEKGWYEFPDRLEPGRTHSFSEVDHNILSSGFALLFVHTLRETPTVIGYAPLEISVLDSRNQAVPFEPYGGVRLSRENLRGETQTGLQEGRSSFAFESFRSLTGTEVKQYVLVAIAIAALLLNALFGLLNYLK